MAPEDKLNQPDGVIEHDGLLWKPKEGATSSVEEFLAARALCIELHDDADWNPWVLNDRAKDLERAQQIMGEWTRAEPGHRPMTKKQIDAMMARQDREFKARQAADRERCDRDRLRYDQSASMRGCLCSNISLGWSSNCMKLPDCAMAHAFRQWTRADALNRWPNTTAPSHS
ncbi:hypothetical protein [Nonomuraea sp. NPDC050202]|uniref:hypothetical protein n=1 Tax=Nonomuraea sp. NPDC050202 TaxID=3155035 RepID=UPI0033FE1EAD